MARPSFAHRPALGPVALLALAALFVALTVLTSWGLRGARLDLTQNRIYTTAPGTQRIVRSLAEPVNLYFFLSENAAGTVPALRTYGARVREFLEDLAAGSGGKLRLTIIDPQPFSEEEDRAAAFGVRAVPLPGAERSLYFGLAGTNSTDGKAIIDFFDPSKEEFLEYDVAKLIYQLGHEHKPVVGWLSSLPMQGGFDPASGQQGEPWVVYGQAQQLFDLRTLEKSLTAIAADVDVLVVVHPKELPPAALFAIDQYALRGGRVLLFVDPVAEGDASGAEPGNPLAAAGTDRASSLAPLLAAWGVDFDPALAIGDLERGITVAMRAGAPPTRHIGILGLDPSSVNPTDVVTASLTSLNFASSGFLAPRKGVGTSFEPLLQTSAQAAPIPAARFQMLMDPATLRDGFRPTGQRYALAARIGGRAKSAFPTGAPAGASLPAGATALRESAKPLNVIVVADTDMLADFLWVRQQNLFGERVARAWANNGDFVWNAIDNLAGSSDLIGIRGRARFTRPFDRVEALRTAAEDRFRAKEQELESELTQTEQKLQALQSQGGSAGAILTPEQEREIERFQGEKLRIRKDLRGVRLQLDQEISALGQRLKLLNIVVAPLVFALLALLVALWRRRLQAAIVALQRERQAPRTAPQDAP
ncbi:MAG: Gldg family protein [Steroidobacteraceae bacterium]